MLIKPPVEFINKMYKPPAWKATEPSAKFIVSPTEPTAISSTPFESMSPTLATAYPKFPPEILELNFKYGVCPSEPHAPNLDRTKSNWLHTALIGVK
jgi:hypothetical protein